MPTFSNGFGPVSAATVNAAEKRLGITLPADYKQFLCTTNGGAPSPAVFAVPQCGDVLLDFLYGLRGVPKPLDLEQEQSYAQEFDPLPAGFLVIGQDPGGNALLLDTNDGGAVYYWDQVGFYPGTTLDGNTYPLNSSFTEFIESLRELSDAEPGAPAAGGL